MVSLVLYPDVFKDLCLLLDFSLARDTTALVASLQFWAVCSVQS